ncbi:hypothetical protein [uncultured Thiocystis sp.]|jgi:hypothetical protein|uniref:hypothetical protein n=1 Tax=uncultured Thiocystis sp. TaxID=1202134 RepID=UPI0025F8DB95|nr:hypothetical protein [uncultured Thiocystis sp.]
MKSLPRPLLTLALIALAGCAGPASRPAGVFQENPAHARAVNVLMAAGCLDATSPRRPAVANDTGYAIVNARLPPLGVDLGMAVGMRALSLRGQSPSDPLSSSRLLAWMPAWMPASLAATPEQARDTLRRLVDAALAAALTDNLPPSTVSTRRRIGTFVVIGDRCHLPSVACRSRLEIVRTPILGHAPSWFGGDPAWTWITPSGKAIAATLLPSVTDQRVWPARHPLGDPIWQSFKASAPACLIGLIFTLAPGTVSRGDGTGFLQDAQVLHRGQALSLAAPLAR